MVSIPGGQWRGEFKKQEVEVYMSMNTFIVLHCFLKD